MVGFEEPRAGLEQYHTPAELAAHIVHVADLQGDIEERTVLDLGSGTGMLSLAAALRGPTRVVGVELDPAALRTARENERRVGTYTDVEWVRGDATNPPLRRREADRREASDGASGSERSERHASRAAERSAAASREDTTVLMNPPFGAQRGNEHADREFLVTAARLADVSYSVHNAGSREFVEAFAADEGGEVTHAFRAELELPHQFEFHTDAERTLDAEVFRIDWSGTHA